MLDLQNITPVEIKASLLSNGISLSERALAHYGLPFLEKRRAYGNQDPVEYRGLRIPQEVYVSAKSLITAVNIKPNSRFQIDYSDGRFFIHDGHSHYTDVDFPRRPAFYDELLATGERVSQVITLYGGASLAVFAFANCDLVKRGVPCHYCVRP